MPKYSQIDAYLDRNRNLKFQEEFVIRHFNNYIEKHNEAVNVVSDIGCGDGLLLKNLATLHKSILFKGFDIAEELINIANSRKPERNLIYEVHDCSKILNKKSDIVIASGLLSIFNNWEEIINLWLKNLNEKGTLLIFGGFNPFDVDVKVLFKNNLYSKEWENGLDIISLNSLNLFCTKKNLAFENLGEFRPPIKIHKSENPIRSYTIKDEDESNLVINGALQIRRFFLVKISRKSF